MFWFTADPHFGHKKIAQYCRRPYNSTEEMDSSIIENINSKVSKSDILYILGDFCFSPKDRYGETARIYRERINCKNCVLIYGNHDYRGRSDKEFREVFSSCHDVLEIEINKQKIFLCHYAMKVWPKSHRGAFHLYGHSHGTMPDDPHSLSMDVGVDCNNYFPFAYEEIVKILSKKKWRPVDRHGIEGKGYGK